MTETNFHSSTLTSPKSTDILQQLTILYQASLAIGRATTEQEVVQAIIKHLSYGEFDRGLVILFRDQKEPRGEACGHWDRSTESEQNLPPSQWMESSYLAQETRYFNDIPSNPDSFPLAEEQLGRLGVYSAAAVQLQTHDAPVGALILESRREFNFSAEFLMPYQALAFQAATVLENHRLLATERQRTKELDNLVAISKAFGAIADLRQTYRELTQHTAEALGAEQCLIALYDPTSREIIGQQPAYGVSDAVAESFRYPSTQKLRDQWHLQQQGPYITNNPQQDIMAELEHFVHSFDVQSLLVIPMQAKGEVIGMIFVANKPGGFGERDGQLGAVFANQAVMVARNAQLYQEQQQRAQETEILNTLMAAASSAMELEEILHQTLVELTSIFSCQAGLISLLDQTRETLSLVTQYRLPDTLAASLAEGDMNNTLCALAISEKKPLIVADIRAVSKVNTAGLVAHGFRSYLGAPLVAEGEILGTLCIFSHSLNHFTKANSDLIAAVGQQIGMAVRNALRYKEVQRRAVQIQTAAEISRAASSALELETLFSNTVELIRQRFDYYYVGLFIVDEAKKWAVLQAGTGEAGQQMVAAGHRLQVGGRSMIGQAITNAEAQISLDVEEYLIRTANPYLPDTRSEMALPLVSRDTVIGALTAQSTVTGAFSQQDITILQTMVDQLANAISKIHLLEQLQGSLSEIQKRERRQVQDDWGIQAIVRDAEGRGGYEYDLLQVRPSPKTSGDGATTPALIEPLTLSGEVIGTLGIENETPNYQWTEDEIAIVNAVATQVAQAMDRAYHSEQSERRAIQLETAAQVGQAVASASMLTADELMDQAVGLVADLFAFHHVAIYLLNEAGDRAVLQTATGHAGGVMKKSNYSVPIDGTMPVNLAIKELRPHIALDTDLGSWIPHPLLPETRSEIALPLLSGGQTLGALDIHSTGAAVFDQVYAAVLHTVADQIAAALINARLFEEIRQSAADQQMLFDATAVAVTTADTNAMLQGVAQAIYDHMACTDVVIMMVEGATLRRRAGFGVTSQSEELDLESTVQIAIGEGVIGWVALTGEPLIAGDVLQSSRYIAAVSTTRSEMAVPITVDQKVVGVINIESDQLDAFDEKELRLLQTLSGTLGSILRSMQLVDELQGAYEEIKEIDRLKSEFLANMSHELRTPLNSIIGFSRVILKGIDGPITQLQEQDLTSVYNSGQHLLELINNVLDLSKIEAGKMEFVPEEVQVNRALNVVMSTAVGLVKDKEVKIRLDAPPELPSVWMDPIRLRQVLLNLVSNAAKFTEEGTITIQAACDPQAVFIQVVDTGIGISEKDMDKLFKSFSQVDASSTRRAGGSGLGLAISAQLMELQGGRIWVESQVGVGSTFSVALPRINAAGDGPMIILNGAPAEPESSKKEPLHPDEPAPMILVIEDEHGVVDLYQRYLVDHNYQIESAATGQTGIEQAIKLADQLVAITVDIIMPDIDGWEIIRQLGENPITQHIPIIICSIILDQARAKALGVKKYLVKPILQGDMLEALRECRLSEK